MPRWTVEVEVDGQREEGEASEAEMAALILSHFRQTRFWSQTPGQVARSESYRVVAVRLVAGTPPIPPVHDHAA